MFSIQCYQIYYKYNTQIFINLVLGTCLLCHKVHQNNKYNIYKTMQIVYASLTLIDKHIIKVKKSEAFSK